MHTPSGSAPKGPLPAQDVAPEATLLSLGLEPTPLERPSKVRRSSPFARILGLVAGAALTAAGSCDPSVSTVELSTGLDNGTVSRAELPAQRQDSFG